MEEQGRGSVADKSENGAYRGSCPDLSDDQLKIWDEILVRLSNSNDFSSSEGLAQRCDRREADERRARADHEAGGQLEQADFPSRSESRVKRHSFRQDGECVRTGRQNHAHIE